MHSRHTVFPLRSALVVLLVLAVFGIGAAVAYAQDESSPAPQEERPVGLTVNTGAAEDGYVLISMLQSRHTLLVSSDGRVVKYWQSEFNPALSVYLMENGDLIRTASRPDVPFGPTGVAGFMGGRIEVFNWDGEIINAVDYMDDRYAGHHDIEPMPNGNILILAYERYNAEEAATAGRNPDLIPEDLEIWSEKITEIDPQTGEVVWEWRVWDHLIQDIDPEADNYGVVADHPERIDLNYTDSDLEADWLHMNAVAYNAALDQIVLSNKNFSEIWIIDHGIGTEEASTEAGDLLYRWGNPEAHGAGTDDDQVMFGQHDSHWIPEGYPGAGNILIFDNGAPERPHSRVVEIAPPVDENGTYVMLPGEPTGPDTPVWEYVAGTPEDFFAPYVSGAQRQLNGDTLVTSGPQGRIFEVTPEGEIVWEYYLPPTARAFRAEKYDLTAFGDFDQGQDLSAELRFDVIWGSDCADGTQPRLHAYLSNEADSMTLFIDTHGEDAAQGVWEMESCAEHEGLAE